MLYPLSYEGLCGPDQDLRDLLYVVGGYFKVLGSVLCPGIQSPAVVGERQVGHAAFIAAIDVASSPLMQLT